MFQATDYQRFLNKLVPIFLKILGDGQPIFVSTIPEQVTSSQIPRSLIELEIAHMHIRDSSSITSQ